MTHRATVQPASESFSYRRACLSRSLLILPLLLSLAGCGEEPNDPGMTPGPITTGTTPTGATDAPTGTSPVPTAPDTSVPPAGGACLNTTPPNDDGNYVFVAQPANNYRFSSSLAVSLTQVAPNTDLTFDWSALTVDFLGHSVDPLADIDTVVVVLWALTPEQVTEKLNADELGAAFNKGAMVIYTQNMVTSGSTHAAPPATPEAEPQSEDFQVPGGGALPHHEVMGRFDPMEWDPATHSYTVLVQEGGELGKGVRMVHAFQLDPASTTTELAITPQSASLSYDTSLRELTPVSMPVGVNNVLVDWSEMTMNAFGRPFLPRSVDEVLVAKYTQTPEQLEGEFLDLELIADEMYRGAVAAGSTQALTGLAKEDGTPFAGISNDGTWILALMCSSCANPAPWYLTLLTPCQ